MWEVSGTFFLGRFFDCSVYFYLLLWMHSTLILGRMNNMHNIVHYRLKVFVRFYFNVGRGMVGHAPSLGYDNIDGGIGRLHTRSQLLSVKKFWFLSQKCILKLFCLVAKIFFGFCQMWLWDVYRDISKAQCASSKNIGSTPFRIVPFWTKNDKNHWK